MTRAQHIFVVTVPPLLGAGGLCFATLSADGSPSFYAGTFVAAAVWWFSWWLFGGAEDGSRNAFLEAFRPRPSYRPVQEALRGFLLGAGLLAIFVVSALVVMRIPVFAEPVDKLMDNVRIGGLALTAFTTAINAAGEEAFFRHVLIRKLELLGVSGKWLAVAAIGIYALVTVAMGVALLVFAAVVLGALTYYEARRSAGVVSPMVAHMTWSLGMMIILPLTL